MYHRRRRHHHLYPVIIIIIVIIMTYTIAMYLTARTFSLLGRLVYHHSRRPRPRRHG